MRLQGYAALGTSLLLIGCSTHRVSLDYKPTATATASLTSIPAITVGEFQDQRGDDAQRGDNGNWFGAIRGGYGNSVKTLLADKPMREVVADSFEQGVKARGMDNDPSGTANVLDGAIKSFACKQYVRRDCVVAIEVAIRERVHHRLLFSKIL